MPATAALREVAAVAGDRDIEDRELLHRLGMRAREGKRSWSAPVVSDEKEFLYAEVVHQPPHIVRDGLLVVVAGGTRRVAEAAQVRCNHAVLGREVWNDVAPLVRCLRDAVQKKNGWRGLTRCAVVHDYVAKIGEVAGDVDVGGACTHTRHSCHLPAGA